MILVLVGGFAFAQEEEAAAASACKIGAISLSGSASLEWGIDLGSGKNATATHGFKNTSSASLKIPISGLDEDAKVTPTDADVYAFIKVKTGGTAKWAGGTALTAPSASFVGSKIVAYHAYMTIADAPAMTTGNTDKTGFGYGVSAGFKGMGTKIGYAREDILGGFDFGLKFVSNGAWDNAAMNSKYGLGFDADISPVVDYLTINTGFNMTFDNAGVYGNTVDANHKVTEKAVGFGLGLTSKLLEKTLVLGLGFDGVVNGAAHDFDYAIGFDADYEKANIGHAHFAFDYSGVKEDMAVSMSYSTLTGRNGDTTVVDGLGLTFKMSMWDLLTFSKAPTPNRMLPMYVSLNGFYKIPLPAEMSITPKFGVEAISNYLYAGDTKPSFAVAYNIGVDFDPLSNLTIGLSWKHGSVTGEGKADAVVQTSKPCMKNVHNGTFVMSATVGF